MRGEEAEFIGIDVSKPHLDIACDGKRTFPRHVNHAQGCAALARDLGGARLVVVEATGGYELEIVRALQSAVVPVAVVNPRRVRDLPAPADAWPRPTASRGPEAQPQRGYQQLPL